MPTLVNITLKTQSAVQVWGFHDPMSLRHITKAMETIAVGLSGDGQEIPIMSGTHRYCI